MGLLYTWKPETHPESESEAIVEVRPAKAILPPLVRGVCENIVACGWQPQSVVQRSFGDGEWEWRIRTERPLRGDPSPSPERIRSASLRTSFEAATPGGLRRQGNAALKS